MAMLKLAGSCGLAVAFVAFFFTPWSSTLLSWAHKPFPHMITCGAAETAFYTLRFHRSFGTKEAPKASVTQEVAGWLLRRAVL